MRKEVTNFSRMHLFEQYHNKSNPFSFVTTKIDITNLYKKCKVSKNTYATIGYYVTLAVNAVDAFHYRYENGKIYWYDVIRPNFTQMFIDQTIGFFTCEWKEDYDCFLEEYERVQSRFLENHASIVSPDDGEVWLSCQPWFHFSGLVTPFDKEITTPQIIWDQFSFENDKCYVNMMIMVHHGFADGYHIGQLIHKLEELIAAIETK